MADFLLPKNLGTGKHQELAASRRITLVGANGSGKSRFMRRMMEDVGETAYLLSALKASFPERQPNTMTGSIDALYAHAVKTQPYLRSDAVSEIDKLAYMLLSDEFESLLGAKSRAIAEEKPMAVQPTKLDKVIELWEHIFPGNSILRNSGRLLFANDTDESPATAMSLSGGEKAIFYYIAATLYAMPHAVIFIENPTLFLHPAIINTLWNAVEDLRPDCTFVYNTVDADFVNSRTDNTVVWIRSFDLESDSWDYEVMGGGTVPDNLFVALTGSRRPVLFIEGDGEHSIDAKLYTLVFSDYTVRPLGSCNKVIEATRTFNDLQRLHHLDSHGIVDRDRRTPQEVGYLRRKNIFVPNVAEVENIFLLESVIKIMARRRGRDAAKVFGKVKRNIMSMFAGAYQAQALQHVRHRIKRDVECKIDARFKCITAVEAHLRSLIDKLQPRRHYEELLMRFSDMITNQDYDGVLKVYNHKPMLSDSGVANLLGFKDKDAYINGVLEVLKGNGKDARALRTAIKYCFELPDPNGETSGEATEAPEGFPYAAKPKHAGKRSAKKKMKHKLSADERQTLPPTLFDQK